MPLKVTIRRVQYSTVQVHEYLLFRRAVSPLQLPGPRWASYWGQYTLFTYKTPPPLPHLPPTALSLFSYYTVYICCNPAYPGQHRPFLLINLCLLPRPSLWPRISCCPVPILVCLLIRVILPSAHPCCFVIIVTLPLPLPLTSQLSLLPRTSLTLVKLHLLLTLVTQCPPPLPTEWFLWKISENAAKLFMITLTYCSICFSFCFPPTLYLATLCNLLAIVFQQKTKFLCM